MRHKGESVAVDTAQPLLTDVERKSGIWEYTLEQWCQPRKENPGPSCPNPGTPPLIWKSPAAAPSRGGRKNKRQKKKKKRSKPHNIDKSLSASAQTFLLEFSNPLEKALPPQAAAIGKTSSTSRSKAPGQRIRQPLLLLIMPLASVCRPGPNFPFSSSFYPKIQNRRFDLSL